MKRTVLIVAGLFWIQFMMAQLGNNNPPVSHDAPAPPDDSFTLTEDTLWFVTSDDFVYGKQFRIVNPHDYGIDIQHIDQTGTPCPLCTFWYTTPYYSVFPVTIPALDSIPIVVKFIITDFSSSSDIFDTLNVNTTGNSRHVIIAADSSHLLIGMAEPGNEKIFAAPNPFTDRLKIYLGVNDETSVKVMIYNALMQPVRELYTGIISPGDNSFVWDGCDFNGIEVSNGIYFVNFRTASGQKTLKVVKV